MFDIGWGELFLIGVVALIVVGPKDLPGLLRTLGQFTGRARMMARDFQRSLEAAADEAGMSEVQNSLRNMDTGLGSASDAARRFAERKTAGIGEDAPAPAPGFAPKPVVRAPAATAPAAPSAAPAAPRTAAPDPAPKPEPKPEPEPKAAP